MEQKPTARLRHRPEKRKGSHRCKPLIYWLRGQDLNLRPSGYEPDELPDCSTPRQDCKYIGVAAMASNGSGKRDDVIDRQPDAYLLADGVIVVRRHEREHVRP